MKGPLWVLAFAATAALVVASSALAHARISPSVAQAKSLELYSLVVPTEKEGLTTTEVKLYVPDGFTIDSYVPMVGWKRFVVHAATYAGDAVGWSGGTVPTGEDAVFQFLAEAQSARTYTFAVQQTYSDGSEVNWTGSASADAPAPTVEAKTSLGGGGSSTLALVALVAAGVGILLGGLALVSKSGRELT